VASGLNDVAQIAECVQTFVNAQSDTLGTWQKITVRYGTPEAANQIWSLLDSDTTAHGHCGEASYLMEQMLRLLGILAVQKHVYGRDYAEKERRRNPACCGDCRARCGLLRTPERAVLD
jgi:hypothetical protein